MDLEELLRSELGQARLESSGTFTMAREQALQKLAGFQLPSTHRWVCKMVQAAVASGCSGLRIVQTARETRFYFESDPGWLLAEVERAFYNPESESQTGLTHLKQGLWSVGLQHTRAFCLVGIGWSEALFWNGMTMTRQPADRPKQTTLAISHRTYHERNDWLVARELQSAARINAELLLELRERAFTCPIPLSLDGLRLDALQNCPDHGLTPASYPLQMGLLAGDFPELGVPPATLDRFSRDPKLSPEMEKLVFSIESLPRRCAFICLVTAHVRRAQTKDQQGWRGYSQASCIYWVRDGVVVDRRAFSLTKGYVSLGLIASCEGLNLDLSGFALLADQAYRQRLADLCRQVQPFLDEVVIHTDRVRDEARKTGRRTGIALVAGGLGLFALEPVSGSCLTLAGLLQAITGRAEGLEVLAELERDLENLKVLWRTNVENIS